MAGVEETLDCRGFWMQGSGANSLEITLGEKSNKKKPLSRIAFIQRSQISKTSFDSDLNLKVIRKTVSTPPRHKHSQGIGLQREWKEAQKMWRKTSKKMNVEIPSGVYEFTRWGRPPNPRGNQRLLLTCYISASCTQEQHSVFIRGH